MSIHPYLFSTNFIYVIIHTFLYQNLYIMSLVNWKNNNKSLPMVNTMIDNFFNDDLDFFNRWNSMFPKRSAMTIPAVNVIETDDSFGLELAAPGMEKKDFKIEIDKGVLNISAENSSTSEEEDNNYTRREYSYNSFSRSFWLPEGVKENEVKAKYDKGLLKISIPKSEVKPKLTAKKIDVA